MSNHEPFDPYRLARRRDARSGGLRRRRRAALMALGLAAVLAVALIAVLASSGGGAPKDGPGGARVTALHVDHHAGGSAGSGTHPRGVGVATRHGPPGTAAVPILMYHVINAPPGGAPFPGLYVAPSEFEGQMQALHEAGYHAVTMDQLLAYWREGAPLPPGKPIVLSFDNGYQSQYTRALPVLRRYGWVGVENLQLSGLPPSQGGYERSADPGSHRRGLGARHAGLQPRRTHGPPAEGAALPGDRRPRALRRRYHVPVNWFCYPSGHYDAAVVAEVKAAGFVGSTTVVPGWASPTLDPYRLPRIRVLGGTHPQALLELIDGVRTNPPPPSAYT